MSRGTIHRTVRIDDVLWKAAKAKADAEKVSLSDVIRDALRAYALGNFLDDSRNAVSTPEHREKVKELPAEFRF